MKTSKSCLVMVASVAVLALIGANAWADIVVPNGPIDDRIIMNLGGGAGGQKVFTSDGSGGGTLNPMTGDTSAATILPGSPVYPGPYTMDFVIDTPLVSGNTPPPNTAVGTFQATTFELQDAENGGAVLLSGTIPADFVLKEIFEFHQTLFGADIPFTVTGGSLQPWFATTGKLIFNLPVMVPNPINDFSTDIWAGGSVTLISDEVVPEPASCLLLLIGGGLVLRRRR
jgi:hypothetical protein